jgi:hypothetical protein
MTTANLGRARGTVSIECIRFSTIHRIAETLLAVGARGGSYPTRYCRNADKRQQAQLDAQV